MKEALPLVWLNSAFWHYRKKLKQFGWGFCLDMQIKMWCTFYWKKKIVTSLDTKCSTEIYMATAEVLMNMSAAINDTKPAGISLSKWSVVEVEYGLKSDRWTVLNGHFQRGLISTGLCTHISRWLKQPLHLSNCHITA